jgi:multiple sugar transport system ATP-binding protein
MVFESYALYPQLSVFDNMAFPLRSPKFRLPEDQVKERVTQYAKVMKIDHLLDRQITALSNGQRQRTALGRALVRKPDIFLLDEPLSHLDAKLRHSMRAELKEMRSQLGTTTLYVTHDYLEAMSLGDRIVVINEGETLQIGTPKEVYFYPASTLVAQLFGDPEVNLLDANIKSKGGTELQLLILGENVPIPLTADVAQVLQKKSREKIRVGIRPSDVRIVSDGGKNAFHGVVYSFEPLGTKSVLTVQAVDGTRIRALVDGHLTFEMDRRVQFSIEPRSLLTFDPDSLDFLARSEQTAEAITHG